METKNKKKQGNDFSYIETDAFRATFIDNIEKAKELGKEYEASTTLRNVVQHTDKPTINDVVQAMASDYHILAESDVALIWNGYGYEMVNMKVEDEK